MQFLSEDIKSLDFTDCPHLSDNGLKRVNCKYLVKIDLTSNLHPRDSVTYKGTCA